jgi:4-amino-4-deoxy-L-arabinose transferase-like glycosyltransferase
VKNPESLSNSLLVMVLCSASFVLFTGLFGDLTGDAVKYASITKAMMESGDYINIKDLGKPYLQKPPLLFWLTAVSFSVFGYTSFAYKIIPVLLALFSGYATYRLARLYYTPDQAKMSALLLLTSFAYFFFHNDVHTDSVLTSLVIIGLWQIGEHFQSGTIRPFLIAMVMFAAAMLTKGPVGILVPAFAIFSHLVLKRDVQQLFHWKWLAGGVLVLLLLIPGLAGLYHQFGWEGIIFYFWTNNFGRITGSYERNSSDYFFYIHTFLWLFLPWSVAALLAMGRRVIEISRQKWKTSGEGLTIGGTMIYLLIISVASFKSPHYLMVVLPLIAVLTGAYIPSLLAIKWFIITQWVVAILLLIGVVLLNVLLPTIEMLSIGALLVVMTAMIWAYRLVPLSFYALTTSVLAVFLLSLYFNITLLPDLFRYQSAVQSGKELNELAPEDTVYSYGLVGNSLNAFHFYYDGETRYLHDQAALNSTLSTEGNWYYVSAKALEELQDMPVVIEDKRYLPHNSLQAPRPAFINPATRHEHVEDRYIVKLSR